MVAAVGSWACAAIFVADRLGIPHYHAEALGWMPSPRGTTPAPTAGSCSEARRFGLATAEKPESQEICFVPNDDYVAVLEQHLPADAPALARGAIVTTDGERLGEHHGFARFTIGQRRGLPGGFGQPLYVVAIRPETGEIVVGSEADLLASSIAVNDLNWLDEPLRPGDRCEVQIRYRSNAVSAVISEASDSTVSLALDATARAVAPGQSAVLYRGEQVLGGGVIA